MIEGRRFIGSEKTEHYAEVAESRIRTACGDAVTSLAGLQAAFDLEAAIGPAS